MFYLEGHEEDEVLSIKSSFFVSFVYFVVVLFSIPACPSYVLILI